ncbi:MAG TPA: HIT domain-containing protein [Candidatus Obscuribacterales bacterium]
MEFIWTPWRYQYVATVDKKTDCVFCRLPSEGDDRNNLILLRARLNYIVMNLYPYSSGHIMVVPFHHEASLAALDAETTHEMIELAKHAQRVLEAEYHPHGFNIGWNLGKAAGAGVQEHNHLHIVPRWHGDANFVSVLGETRILPEDLHATYDKLVKPLHQPPWTSAIS